MAKKIGILFFLIVALFIMQIRTVQAESGGFCYDLLMESPGCSGCYWADYWEPLSGSTGEMWNYYSQCWMSEPGPEDGHVGFGAVFNEEMTTVGCCIAWDLLQDR